MKKFVGLLFLALIFKTIPLQAVVMGIFLVNKNNGSIVCFDVGASQSEVIKSFCDNPEFKPVLAEYRAHLTHHGIQDDKQQYSMLSITPEYKGEHGYWAVRKALIGERSFISFGAGDSVARAIEDADARMVSAYGIAWENIDQAPYATGSF